PHAYIGIPPREGLEVSFVYEDESGKLPLSTMDKNGLIQLLYALGLEQRDAERVSDALIAWTNKKYESIEEEATDAAYQRAKLSFKPARRALRSFEELRTVGVVKDFFFDEKGNETPLLTSFKECVSLYTFSDTNINTASDALLYAQGLDERQVTLIRDKQANMKQNIAGSPPYFRVTREVRTLIGGTAPLKGFDDEIHLMWIRVTVKEGQAKCRLNALVAIRDDVTYAGPVEDPSTVTAMDAKSTTGIIHREPRQPQAGLLYQDATLSSPPASSSALPAVFHSEDVPPPKPSTTLLEFSPGPKIMDHHPLQNNEFTFFQATRVRRPSTRKSILCSAG
ncbi:hypothetical protein EBZ97_00765, partial [bacterium]|nr:hypothetical protein [bacterium]